jgi:ABC-2 type transport system ATP-binding protein
MLVAALRGITKTFGSVEALRGLDLMIQRGELVALLGPNGAGKTTALRILLGLAKPTKGTAEIFGHEPRSAQARRERGTLLQVSKVPETLRVHEHIELFSSYYQSPLPLRTTLEVAGLEEIANRLTGELSGGQKQRLLFALAICGNPPLLCLDEPTVGLDVESRRKLWHHIRSFVVRGGSVLLTTHYLEEADALADRIAVIQSGRITAEGSPGEIKARATARKILCTTCLDESTLRALPGVAGVGRHRQRCEILAADAENVVRQLLARDASLSDLEITAAGLEEAFLSLTSQEVLQ